MKSLKDTDEEAWEIDVARTANDAVHSILDRLVPPARLEDFRQKTEHFFDRAVGAVEHVSPAGQRNRHREFADTRGRTCGKLP